MGDLNTDTGLGQRLPLEQRSGEGLDTAPSDLSACTAPSSPLLGRKAHPTPSAVFEALGLGTVKKGGRGVLTSQAYLQLFPRLEQGYGHHALPDAASRQVLTDLLRHPARTPTQLEQIRRPLRETAEQLGALDLSALCKEIAEFTDGWNGFRTALRRMQACHYPPDKRQPGELRVHNSKVPEPWPENMECVALLGALVKRLMRIDAMLPSSLTGHPHRWQLRIKQALAHPALTAFTARPAFLEMAEAAPSPCCFLDKRGLQARGEELSGQRGRAEQIDLLQDLHRKRPDLARDAVREARELSEQLETLWDRGQGGRAPHSYLRAFGDNIINAALRYLDCYSRLTGAMRDNGYRLADLAAPGQIHIKNYRSPALSEPHRREAQEPEAISASINPAGTTDRALLIAAVPGSGQSRTLKSVGCAALAHSAGVPVPADSGTRIDLFSEIVPFFPSPEQLRGGEGYFGSTLTELAPHLRSGDKRGSLYLLDNVPAGTDYADLIGVSTSVLQSLIESGATVAFCSVIPELIGEIAERTNTAPYCLQRQDEAKGLPKLALGTLTIQKGVTALRELGLQDDFVAAAERRLARITGEQEVGSHRAMGPGYFGVWNDRLIESCSSGVTKTLLFSFAARYPAEHFLFPAAREMLVKSLAGVAMRRGKESVYLPRFRGLGDALQADKGPFFAYPRASDEYGPEIRQRGREIAALAGQGENFLQELRTRLLPFDHFVRVLGSHGGEQRVREELSLPETRLALARLFAQLETLPAAVLHQNKRQWIEKALQGAEDQSDEGASDYWRGVLFDGIQSLALELDQKTGVALTMLRSGLSIANVVDEPNVLELEGCFPLILPDIRSLERYEIESPGLPHPSVLPTPTPITFRMDPRTGAVGILGPNSAGKSVLLHTIHLEAISALNGFPTSGRLRISFYHDVCHCYAVSKAELHDGSMTHLAMTQLGVALSQNEPVLALVDEFHGFHPFQQAAIQQGFLEAAKARGFATVLVTHVRHGLKQCAEELGVSLWEAKAELSPETGKVLRRSGFFPDPDLTSRSLGAQIAQNRLPRAQAELAAHIAARYRLRGATVA